MFIPIDFAMRWMNLQEVLNDNQVENEDKYIVYPYEWVQNVSAATAGGKSILVLNLILITVCHSLLHISITITQLKCIIALFYMQHFPKWEADSSPLPTVDTITLRNEETDETTDCKVKKSTRLPP